LAKHRANKRNLRKKTSSSLRGGGGTSLAVHTFSLLLIVSSVHGFQPVDRAALMDAVGDLCDDSTAATATYGDISSWGVSLVTDMSDLLFWTTCFYSDYDSDISN
jgi:hypothetical protein